MMRKFFLITLVSVGLIVSGNVQAQSTTTDNAQFVSADLSSKKASYTPGESISLTITAKNTGTSTWDNRYALWPYPGNTDQYAWTTNSGLGLPRSTVNPDEEVTFNLQFRAPQTPQTVALQWRMSKDMPANVSGADQSKFFGDPLPSASISMTVNTPPTIPIATIASSATVNENIGLSVSTIDNERDRREWSVDWGDGTPHQQGGSTCTARIDCIIQYGFATDHAWAQPGTYPITITVTDGNGGQATKTLSIQVTAPVSRPPTPRLDRATFTGKYINKTQPEMKIEFGVSSTDVGYFRLHWVSADNNRVVNTWYRINGSDRSFTGAFDSGHNQIELIAYKEAGQPGVQEDDIASDGVARMGFDAPKPGLLPDNAGFTGSGFPIVYEPFKPGQTMSGNLFFKNTGSSAWTKDEYYLQPANDDAKAWMGNVGQWGITKDVPSGGDYQFSVQLVAPTTPKKYSLQWRMAKLTTTGANYGTYTPFGDLSNPIQFQWTVTNPTNPPPGPICPPNCPTTTTDAPVLTLVSAQGSLPVQLSWTPAPTYAQSGTVSGYQILRTLYEESPGDTLPACEDVRSYTEGCRAKVQGTSYQTSLRLPSAIATASVYFRVEAIYGDGTTSYGSNFVKWERGAPAQPSTVITPPSSTQVSAEEIKLRDRIQQLEYKISDLESKVVVLEKQLFTRSNNNLIGKIKGRVLLQVEEDGEAWYVDPATYKKYYLKDGNSAYTALGAFGLGIKNNDLAKIPVGVETRFQLQDSDGDGLDDKLETALGTDLHNRDTDGDGYSDGDEVKKGYDALGSAAPSSNTTFANKLKGKIVLQVENGGQAWYVNPVDGKRYYMADGQLAYQIMRFLSLGITNTDLRQIPVGEFR